MNIMSIILAYAAKYQQEFAEAGGDTKKKYPPALSEAAHEEIHLKAVQYLDGLLKKLDSPEKLLHQDLETLSKLIRKCVNKYGQLLDHEGYTVDLTISRGVAAD